jgi:hypothetical protein
MLTNEWQADSRAVSAIAIFHQLRGYVLFPVRNEVEAAKPIRLFQL